MGTDDILDILLLIFVLAILSPIMLSNTIPLFKGDIGGFETLIDKTAQKTEEEIMTVKKTITKEDLLLMVVIADEKTTKPSVIQLAIDRNNDNVSNGDELSKPITINDNKVKALTTINDYVPNNMNLKLCTLVGPTGIKKWVVFRD